MSLSFLKLGGSLITDKTRPYMPHLDRIHRLAGEVRQALDQRHDLRLLLGHGSGSFGHRAAAPYGTRQGVRTPEQWRGYAEVAAAAARLNRYVVDAFLDQGVPTLGLQPSASARCRDGLLVHLDAGPVQEALDRGLVPLIYGDVALDEIRGGTIISTEDIFVYLAGLLSPQRILLAGDPPGVLDADGEIVPHISPATFPTVRSLLSGSHAVDVTGGMADKVSQMVAVVAERPGLTVCIFSGREPGSTLRALLGSEHAGTLIANTGPVP